MITNSDPSPHDDAIKAIHGLLTEVVKALVDDADAVRIDVSNESGTIVFRLHVARSDLGKVIGKHGRTARSLRTVLSAASMKYQRRFALDVVGANDSGSEE